MSKLTMVSINPVSRRRSGITLSLSTRGHERKSRTREDTTYGRFGTVRRKPVGHDSQDDSRLGGHFATTLSCASCSPFAAYYQRLRKRGVPGHTAVGHLAGKLISVLFFCMRSSPPYDPPQHASALGLGDAK